MCPPGLISIVGEQRSESIPIPVIDPVAILEGEFTDVDPGLKLLEAVFNTLLLIRMTQVYSSR
jgi:hypothetical protein